MTKRYDAWIPNAQPMRRIGRNEWFATAQIRQLWTGHDNDLMRLPGEWHGRTEQEAETKARRAAEDRIARRS